ncbi:neuromedin-U receptor 2-like [Mizuhopecten yessoensis]|uniref:neuromedin-U receptor 2-like n=1 Tax=Mizuhopecten yessoensis TaxID=6573 RepID=UPI000B45F7A4|nr:neuromedin-U receptor 2-like [Mizuhopecten yessoensis]
MTTGFIQLPNTASTGNDDNITEIIDNQTYGGNMTSPVSFVQESQLEYATSIISVIVFIVGLIGNMLTLNIISNTKFRNLSSRKFLAALSVSNSLLLLTQVFNRKYVIQIFGFDARAISTTGCKTFFVMFKTAKMTSSLFVVSISVERFIAVWFPLKVKFVCVNHVVYIVIAIVYILIGSFNSVWSFSSGVIGGICHPDIVTSSIAQQHKVLLIIGSLLYSIIPLIILIFVTPFIMAKLVSGNKQRRKISQTTSTRIINRNNTHASILVLCILISYMLLVIPITIFHNVAFFKGVRAFGENDESFETFKSIAQMLEQINYAINFFLYTMVSEKFRRHLLEMFCCHKIRAMRDSTFRGLSKRTVVYTISAESTTK